MHKLIRLFATGVFVAAALAQQPPAFRLGDAVKPLRYAADLTVVPAQDTFSGAIDIALSVGKSTPVLWLNATDLTIREATLSVNGTTSEARVLPGGKDFVGFAFARPLQLGGAALHIVYSGKISSRSSSGVFRNQVAGAWYAFTQFEAIDARRAFPCFDEPSFKVPWQLTLHVKREHMALSNTPVLSQTDEPNDMKAVRFSPTRPLPSYLVAFAVGPFDAVDAGRVGAAQTPLRIIVPHGMADQAKYAAAVTPQLLATLEGYFGIPYPYEKLDSVAVPLMGGAMENAGLITYSQSLILSKPSLESLAWRRRYASVAAHEMAHMWFGDLVTTAWWNDIWLNEAFATWMSTKTLETWKPEWHADVSAAVAGQGAMDADSLVSARRIRQPVDSNSDIANAFDTITYEKGAAVIAMFEHWLGPETFRKGVRLYLKRHAWGNATAADFLSALDVAAGRDVAPAFSTFLDQPGVPLLSGEVKCGGAQPPRLSLSQQRYLPLGSHTPSPELWQIPVCVRGSGPAKGAFCALFTQASGTVDFPAGASCPSWLLLNDAETGYYRVRYRGDMLDRLTAGDGKLLSPVERVGIVGDVRALYRGGELPAAAALRTAAGFANDPTRQVVSSTIDFVGGVGRSLVPANLRASYERFVRQVYGPRAHELGWTPKPGESDSARLLRPELVPFVADEGADPELIAGAERLASAWLDNRSGIAPGMLGAVLETAAAHGGRPLYDRMTAALAGTEDPAERRALLDGMAVFPDPAIIKANFELVIAGKLDPREAAGLLFGPARNPETRAIPFDLVRNNYDRLVAALPSGITGGFSAYLPMVGRGFCDAKHRNEVEAFFKPRVAQTVGGTRILAQTVEAIDQCIAVRKSQEPGVVQFLKSY
jgi:alanyl aminopeptidase